MGQDKGLVLLAGEPLIEHVLACVNGLGDEVLITTNNPEAYEYLGVRTASDREPGAGALPGLATALEAARGDAVLVLACDMPFLDRSLLAHLLALAPRVDAVVPRWLDRYQTMHAVYRREPCLNAIQNMLSQGRKRLISFYDDVRLLTVAESEVARFDPAGRSFFNINTPGDLVEAERIFAEK